MHVSSGSKSSTLPPDRTLWQVIEHALISISSYQPIQDINFRSIFSNFSPDDLLDAIWILDQQQQQPQTEGAHGQANNQDAIQPLAMLLSMLVLEHKLIPIHLAKERLEAELLEAAGILGEGQAVPWTRRQVRLNTAALYKQHRYNLYREETEGYARMLVYLLFCNSQIENRGSEYVESMLNHLIQLIGFFDLDPNRLVEAVLLLGNESILNVVLGRLRLHASTLASLLGFHLMNTRQFFDQERLFWVIGWCLKHNHFGLEHIWPYLNTEEGKEALPDNEAPTTISNLPAANDTLIAHEVALEMVPAHSQMISLCNALIQHEMWELIQKLPLTAPLWNVSLNRSLARALHLDPGNEFIRGALGPFGLYHHQGMASQLLDKLTPMDNMLIFSMIIPTMTIAYGNTALSTQLWYKHFSHVSHQLRYAQYTHWHSIMTSSDTNSTSTSLLSKAHVLARADTKRLLRRLAKENVRQYGRLLGKLAHPCPTTVLPLLLDQCLAYENMIGPGIEASRYLTPLDLDVLLWSCLELLSRKQAEAEAVVSNQNVLSSSPGTCPWMKEDGVNVAAWLQRLSLFIASLYKKHAGVLSLAPLIDYLAKRMTQVNLVYPVVELCILEAVIEACTGIEPRWEHTEAQIDGLASGPSLFRSLITNNWASSQSNDQAASTLFSLLTPKFLVLMARQPGLALFHTCINPSLPEEEQPFIPGNIKLASTLYDLSMACLIQCCEFIQLMQMSLATTHFNLQNLEEALEGVSVNSVPIAIRALLLRTIASSLNGDNDCIKKVLLIDTSNPLSTVVSQIWHTSLRDLYCPVGRYQSDLARLKTAQLLSQQQGSTAAKNDPNSNSSNTIGILERELKACQTHVQNMTLQLKDVNQIDDSDAVRAFALTVLYPRLILSTPEALFVSRWVILNNGMLAPSNNSLIGFVLDVFTDRAAWILASQTEREARHFGRYMAELMSRRGADDGKLTNQSDQLVKACLTFIQSKEDRKEKIKKVPEDVEMEEANQANQDNCAMNQEVIPELTLSNLLPSSFLGLRASLILLSMLCHVTLVPSVASPLAMVHSINQSALSLTSSASSMTLQQHAFEPSYSQLKLLSRAIHRLSRHDKREDIRVLSTRVYASTKNLLEHVRKKRRKEDRQKTDVHRQGSPSTLPIEDLSIASDKETAGEEEEVGVESSQSEYELIQSEVEEGEERVRSHERRDKKEDQNSIIEARVEATTQSPRTLVSRESPVKEKTEAVDKTIVPLSPRKRPRKEEESKDPVDQSIPADLLSTKKLRAEDNRAEERVRVSSTSTQPVIKEDNNRRPNQPIQYPPSITSRLPTLPSKQSSTMQTPPLVDSYTPSPHVRASSRQAQFYPQHSNGNNYAPTSYSTSSRRDPVPVNNYQRSGMAPGGASSSQSSSASMTPPLSSSHPPSRHQQQSHVHTPPLSQHHGTRTTRTPLAPHSSQSSNHNRPLSSSTANRPTDGRVPPR